MVGFGAIGFSLWKLPGYFYYILREFELVLAIAFLIFFWGGPWLWGKILLVFCRITFKCWLKSDSLIKLCDRISLRHLLLLVCQKGKRRGIVGTVSRVRCAIARKRCFHKRIAPAPYSRNFPFCTGFCKFCVECEREVKEIWFFCKSCKTYIK